MGIVDKQDISLSIRTVTASDNVLLADIGAETFSDSFAVGNTPENMAAYLAESCEPERPACDLAGPASRFLIIESDGLTVGYAHMRSTVDGGLFTRSRKYGVR